MTHLSLTDAVDSPEALFETIRVPWQIIINHQVCALEVDTFAGGIGGQQHLHLGIVLEGFLNFQAFFAADTAVDDDDGFLATEQGSDALFQVIQRVAVLGEDHKLLVWRTVRRRNGSVG